MHSDPTGQTPAVPSWVYDRWASVVPKEELAQYRKAGFGGRMGFGSTVAVVAVDVTNRYVTSQYSMAATHSIDPVIKRIAVLLEAARAARLPIFYSHPARGTDIARGLYNHKIVSWKKPEDKGADEWPELIKPHPEDTLLPKNKSSIFHDTPLAAYLTYLRVDTLVLCGLSTSGCIRTAAQDAFASNFRAMVVRDCVADRSVTAHNWCLFDMDMRSADVVESDDVLKVFAEFAAAQEA
jgi:maleamate amidohydrolase